MSKITQMEVPMPFRIMAFTRRVEQLNKTALKTLGLDSKGQLYKVNFFEFYREEDVIKTTDDPGILTRKHLKSGWRLKVIPTTQS